MAEYEVKRFYIDTDEFETVQDVDRNIEELEYIEGYLCEICERAGYCWEKDIELGSSKCIEEETIEKINWIKSEILPYRKQLEEVA